MKAAVFLKHGSSDNLQIIDIDIPDVGNNEVLIHVKSFALNRLDIWVRNGSPHLKIPLPHIGGSDFSGVVEKIGKSVKNIDTGMRVVINAGISCKICDQCIKGEQSECANFSMIGEHHWGGAAEYAVVPESNVLVIPDHVTFSDAAAITLTSMTAYRMLISKAKLEKEDIVLIIGASGGVGVMAVQLVKLFGGIVIALSSSDEKTKKLVDLGADYVVNYMNPKWAEEVYKLTKKIGKKGVDIVFDSVGESVFSNSISSLAKGGRYVTCGATSGTTGSINLALLFWKQLSIIGSTMANDSEFRDVMKLFFEGKIYPVIDTKFKLNRIIDAHKRLEKGEHFGKIVVNI